MLEMMAVASASTAWLIMVLYLYLQSGEILGLYRSPQNAVLAGRVFISRIAASVRPTVVFPAQGKTILLVATVAAVFGLLAV